MVLCQGIHVKNHKHSYLLCAKRKIFKYKVKSGRVWGRIGFMSYCEMKAKQTTRLKTLGHPHKELLGKNEGIGEKSKENFGEEWRCFTRKIISTQLTAFITTRVLLIG